MVSIKKTGKELRFTNNALKKYNSYLMIRDTYEKALDCFNPKTNMTGEEYFGTITFGTNRNKISEAIRRLGQFQRGLTDFLISDDKNITDVYTMNTSFLFL